MGVKTMPMARVNHQLPNGLTVKLGSSSCAAGAVMPSISKSNWPGMTLPAKAPEMPA
ncbi:hypothetical protein D3C73_1015570 [compost metagenome]